jgi:WD40 repeat protein/class 3 adenylate cyclase
MSELTSARGTEAVPEGDATVERTFLIADVRGYTRFTRERGDAAAARLAKRFAELARDSVEARSGRVIELRGDEALAVFLSPDQAVRAAVDLQAACAEDVAADPTLPLRIGVGIDVGEAVPVEDGFRGAALNTAARLCSQAAAGQVLVTLAVADRAGEISGVDFRSAGSSELKGFESPVELIDVVAMAHPSVQGDAAPAAEPLPIELEPDSQLVGREPELAWLRGTWRQARRGRGRVVVVSGAAQLGKSRLAAELAAFAGSSGASVSYAGAGGTAAVLAASAVREAVAAPQPMLVVLDDFDVTADTVTSLVAELLDTVEATPTMVVGLVRDPEASPELARLIDRLDSRGDGHRELGPLDIDGVREIARQYAGDDVHEVPLESISRASGGIPGRVHEVMSEWAEQEATRRLAAAAEFLAAERRGRAADLDFANNVIGLKLGRLYADDRTVVDQRHGECPYKGLAPFEEDDASLFFGRERLVGELAARTVGLGLLGIVGASGSGKSSVIAAGLLPSLEAGLLPGSDRWRVAGMRPGEHPFAELEALRARTSDGEGRLVLVVDQFEEVFTACQDDCERDRFVENLVSTTGAPEAAVVVVGIRGDYYGHCGAYPELARLLAANHVLVGPMSRDELRRAIEVPARRTGTRVESALTETLVNEIADEPGGLPLLSTALVELWVARSDGWLRLETHERLGGVRGAVARLADSSLENLTDEQAEAVRRMFLRLMTSGDEGAVTRRRVPLSELDLERDPTLAAVVERLTQDRLLTVREGTVEVAHEALLREWPTFQEWLTEDAQGRELREHLTHSAKRWGITGRETGELYRGARLSATLDWAAGRQQELNELEREFLAESRAASERELARQRRANRRLRALLAGVGVLLVLAVIAGALALVARGTAKEAATAATAQRLSAEAQLADDIDLSLLLARQAVELDESAETLSGLEAALVRAPEAIRFERPLPGRLFGPVGVSDDGELIGVTNNVGEVAFLDARTGAVLRTAEADGFGFFPGGHEVSIGRGFPQIQLFRLDVSTGKEEKIAAVEIQEGVSGFSFSDDLRTWATVDEAGRIELKELGSDRVLQQAQLPPGQLPIDLQYHDRYVAVLSLDPELREAGPLRVEVWGLDPWQLRGVVVDEEPVPSPRIAIDAAGRRLVTGRADGSVALFDILDGSSRTMSGRHTADVIDSSFNRDGTLIASGSSDGQAIVWDAKSGRPVHILEAHTAKIFAPGFSPDGRTLYTAGLDGATIAWDLAGSRLLGRSFPLRPLAPPGTVPEFFADEGPALAATSPDGRRLAVLEGGTAVAVHDLETGRRLFATPDHGAPVVAVAWSPDGKEIATGEHTGVTAWSATNGAKVRSYEGAPAEIPADMAPPGTPNGAEAIAFSPDGRLLAAAFGDGPIRLWDSKSGEAVGEPLGAAAKDLGGVALDVTFSPDSSMLVAAFINPDGRGGAAVAWRVSDGKELFTLNIDDGYGRGSAVAFSPDGELLATGGGTGEIKLWDARTGEQSGPSLSGTAGWVLVLEFDQTSKRLVSTGSDGVTRLWDLERRAPFGSPLPGIGGEDYLVADVTADGTRLVVVSLSDRRWLWPLDNEAWKDRACAVAGRTLTEREWELYLPGRSYDPACR